MTKKNNDFFFIITLASTTFILIAVTLTINLVQKKSSIYFSKAANCVENSKRCQPGKNSKYSQFCRNGEWVSYQYCGDCDSCKCEEVSGYPECSN